MSQASRIDLMEKGRTATMVSGAIKDYLDDLEHQKVTRLISGYRAGCTHDYLLGLVAELAAVSELRARLMSDQMRGDVASSKEHERGKA